MEKRIRKIQKWLDRCLEACRAKSWENALADMECANAELINTRDILWEELSGQRLQGFAKRKKILIEYARIFMLAFMFVAATAVPLAVNGSRMVDNFADQPGGAVLEWIEADEHRLIMALRESLSENSFRETLYSDQPAMKEQNRAENRSRYYVAENSSSAGEREEIEENGASAVRRKKTEVSMEEVIALIQIGERSLRDPGSAIEIRK